MKLEYKTTMDKFNDLIEELNNNIGSVKKIILTSKEADEILEYYESKNNPDRFLNKHENDDPYCGGYTYYSLPNNISGIPIEIKG